MIMKYRILYKAYFKEAVNQSVSEKIHQKTAEFEGLFLFVRKVNF